jgi:hypothetical protein
MAACYSNKSRGMRKKAEVDVSAEPSSEDSAAVVTRSSQTWAMLIKRVYKVDPLSCSQCGGEMKVVAFIAERLLPSLRVTTALERKISRKLPPSGCGASSGIDTT